MVCCGASVSYGTVMLIGEGKRMSIFDVEKERGSQRKEEEEIER